MIEIDCNKGKAIRSEDRMAAVLRSERGVLLRNVLVPGQGRSKEIDGVLLSPSGIVPIEAKGTGESGTLRAALNGSWSVDGRPVTFKGHAMPHVQARQAAQMLSSLFRSTDQQILGKSRLRSLSLIVGPAPDSITVDPSTADLQDVYVASEATLLAGVRWCNGEAVDAEKALLVMQTFGLGESAVPSMDELVEEGFAAPLTEKQIEATRARDAAASERGQAAARRVEEARLAQAARSERDRADARSLKARFEQHSDAYLRQQDSVRAISSPAALALALLYGMMLTGFVAAASGSGLVLLGGLGMMGLVVGASAQVLRPIKGAGEIVAGVSNLVTRAAARTSKEMDSISSAHEDINGQPLTGSVYDKRARKRMTGP